MAALLRLRCPFCGVARRTALGPRLAMINTIQAMPLGSEQSIWAHTTT
jgi:hypothetical protein